MKNAIIIAAILATAGLWYYRRYYLTKQKPHSFPAEKFEIVDMEDLIAWFLNKKNHVKDLAGLSGVAVNIADEGKFGKELRNVPPIVPQSENEEYPVVLLLGFYNKSKGEFDLHNEPVIFYAKSMTPVLKNYFQGKSIIVFE